MVGLPALAASSVASDATYVDRITLTRQTNIVLQFNNAAHVLARVRWLDDCLCGGQERAKVNRAHGSPWKPIESLEKWPRGP